MMALVILMARSVCASQADQQRVQRFQKDQLDDEYLLVEGGACRLDWR
jgi:hypothetical protein